MPNAPYRLALINALYPGLEAGLVADLLTARALGQRPLPVCSSILSANSERVTDITEVPADTVQAQLQHITATSPPDGIRVAVLGSHHTVGTVARYLDAFTGPVVLDLIIEGEAGSTVLTPRGVSALRDHLKMATVVIASRRDAELLSEGEIASLDDAQVAAQRLVRRGANAVVIKCGTLAARHFDSETARDEGTMMSDLYFDGGSFGLFEAPYIESSARGSSSAFSVALLQGLTAGLSVEDALQGAKRFATEALRNAENGRLCFDWATQSRLYPN